MEIDKADYAGKKLLLINSDLEKYKPKNKKSLRQYDAIIENDKLWINKLDDKANLDRQIFELATHYIFTDLSILINHSIGKKLGLLGEAA